MTTLSIAMATYNGEKYLPQQLASIAAQTRLPDELVIGDDGSCDQTLMIAREFARHAPFSVIVRSNESNLGYAKNFVELTRYCRGDLIAFCDQDDLWAPQKLEQQVSHLTDDTLMLSSHRVMLVDPNGEHLGTLKPQTGRTGPISIDDVPSWFYVLGMTQVFRRELLMFNSLWQTSIDTFSGRSPAPHDLWFTFLALALGRIHLSEETLVRYRQHGRNASGHKTHFRLIEKLAPVFTKDAGRMSCISFAMNSRKSMIPIILDLLRKEDMSEHTPSITLAGIFYGKVATMYAKRSLLHSTLNLRTRHEIFRQLLADECYADVGFKLTQAREITRDAIAIIAPWALKEA